MHDVTVLADDIDLRSVNLERGKRPANNRKQTADNLAESPKAGDDHRVLLILHLVVLGFLFFVHSRQELFVEQIDNRR